MTEPHNRYLGINADPLEDDGISIDALCESGGWLAIDKGLEITSTRVVSQVRRILSQHGNAKVKVGHGGTLDPLADGILPIAVGRATRTVPYVMDGAKIYRFKIIFGQSRTTDDFEGEVAETCDYVPTTPELEACLGDFQGDILQRPPIFSALRVNGKRSYDLARAGREVELPPRPVRIDALRMIGRDEVGNAEFEVVCGKGAYVRSLARDIARKCGSLGFVGALRRLKCGPFTEKHAISVEKLAEIVSGLDKGDENGQKAGGRVPAWSISSALADILALEVSLEDARSLLCGRTIAHEGSCAGSVCRIVLGKRVLGLAKIGDDKVATPYKMFATPMDLEGITDVDYQ